MGLVMSLVRKGQACVGFVKFLSRYCLCQFAGKSGKGQCTPSKAGGDRFIPCRNSKQMDVATFLLAKENEPVEPNASNVSVVCDCSCIMALNA